MSIGASSSSGQGQGQGVSALTHALINLMFPMSLVIPPLIPSPTAFYHIPTSLIIYFSCYVPIISSLSFYLDIFIHTLFAHIFRVALYSYFPSHFFCFYLCNHSPSSHPITHPSLLIPSQCSNLQRIY